MSDEAMSLPPSVIHPEAPSGPSLESESVPDSSASETPQEHGNSSAETPTVPENHEKIQTRQKDHAIRLAQVPIREGSRNLHNEVVAIKNDTTKTQSERDEAILNLFASDPLKNMIATQFFLETQNLSEFGDVKGVSINGVALSKIVNTDGDVFTCEMTAPDGTVTTQSFPRSLVSEANKVALLRHMRDSQTDFQKKATDIYIGLHEGKTQDEVFKEVFKDMSPEDINTWIKENGRKLSLPTEDQVISFIEIDKKDKLDELEADTKKSDEDRAKEKGKILTRAEQRKASFEGTILPSSESLTELITDMGGLTPRVLNGRIADCERQIEDATSTITLASEKAKKGEISKDDEAKIKARYENEKRDATLNRSVLIEERDNLGPSSENLQTAMESLTSGDMPRESRAAMLSAIQYGNVEGLLNHALQVNAEEIMRREGDSYDTQKKIEAQAAKIKHRKEVAFKTGGLLAAMALLFVIMGAKQG